MRTGSDDALRQFPDEPVPMPPVSCLLRGCEGEWFNSRDEFLEHCDAMHEGYQSYRLRVLHLLSKTVFQFPGSLQRAAMQNFAEFQCRSETDWQNFTPAMKEGLHEGLSRTQRWTPRAWVACCVCTMQAWQEERMYAYIAGAKCCFKHPQAVAKLLDPEAYAAVWTSLPSDEIKASAVQLHLPTGKGDTRTASMIVLKSVLLHKRRVTQGMREGTEPASLCHVFYNCLVKLEPEMPVNALANGMAGLCLDTVRDMNLSVQAFGVTSVFRRSD